MGGGARCSRVRSIQRRWGGEMTSGSAKYLHRVKRAHAGRQSGKQEVQRGIGQAGLEARAEVSASPAGQAQEPIGSGVARGGQCEQCVSGCADDGGHEGRGRSGVTQWRLVFRGRRGWGRVESRLRSRRCRRRHRRPEPVCWWCVVRAGARDVPRTYGPQPQPQPERQQECCDEQAKDARAGYGSGRRGRRPAGARRSVGGSAAHRDDRRPPLVPA